LDGKKMKSDTINVVIPLYNHEKYIEECLVKLIDCNLKQLKIVMVDDASSDSTLTIAKNIIYNNKNNNKVSFKLIEKRRNRGVTHSLNMGLRELDEGIVYFIASDDFIDSSKFVCAIDKLKQNNLDFIILNGNNYFENGNVKRIYNKGIVKFLEQLPLNRDKALFIDYPKPLLLQTMIFRTSVISLIGEWDESIGLDDYPFFIRLFSLCEERKFQYQYLSELAVVYYRMHESNSHSDLFRQFNLVNSIFDTLAPDYIRCKATGSRLSLYLLMSIKRGNIRLAKKLLSVASFKSILWSLYFLPFNIVKKLSGKHG